ncbi:hypothetical protein [Vampirovibrio chlorellavorus]|uniref:hypothetical protein n=1 Tax=Vampirovibrio chlorellavorus TaxID=758823 RepID=UPI0026EE2E48|nr:hypothetical protein [Vampirovibrio chlorellavorus]
MALRHPVLNGLILALSLGLLADSLSVAAELNGFAIDTQDKNVTVTLFTDQRVSYSTEHQGKQFAIILPETQLSQEQLDNGLPVVLDNKNRFIGRAVPHGDGKVKIILPNLAANEYAVSVQQQHSKQPQKVATSSPEKLKPRPAVSKERSDHFEQVAAHFEKPSPKKETASASASNHRLKLSPTPVKATQGGVWNPYVYRPSDFQPEQPVRKASKPVPASPSLRAEPINTLSVAESMPAPPAGTATNADPLWYLHALPPAQPMPADALKGPAASAQGQTHSPNVTNVSQPAKVGSSELKELTSEVRKGFQSIPQWLFITVAVFFGGIGVFCVIGALVLLKILFTQVRQSVSNGNLPASIPYVTGLMPLYPAPGTAENTAPDELNASGKAAYASRPSYGQTSLRFEDKSAIKALDYLKETPASVTQAIHNTRVSRLQSRKRTNFREFPQASNR